MKKQFLTIITIAITSLSFSQITFEKGYFINESGIKTSCLIKNIDWKNSPEKFKYKLEEKSEIKTASIKNVTEFSVVNGSKFIRREVKIDTSSNSISKLSFQKTPLYKRERVLLHVLVEGDANLYLYENKNLKRYFLTTSTIKLKPLVYKKFKTENNQIGVNSRYKQELMKHLKCDELNIGNFRKLEYNKKSLTKLLIDYNTCKYPNFVLSNKKETKNPFHITIRPRLNLTNVSFENQSSIVKEIDFDQKSNLGIGVEFEYVLPYNSNKISLFAEPTYQNYSSSKNIKSKRVPDGEFNTVLKYNSINIPLGVRHYFFLNDNSKIYADIAYVFTVNLNAYLDFNRKNGTTKNSLNVTPLNNLSISLGYKYNEKYSISVRAQTNRELVPSYSEWNSSYQLIILYSWLFIILAKYNYFFL